MPKNLVVLLDGTNNQFGDNNTNITKLMSVLVQDPDRQLVFYAAGVGTFGLREVVFQWQQLWPRVLGLAFGWGVRQTLESAYRFLLENYVEGDVVYIFGFSRGAYAARSLCALLKGIGLLHAHMPNQFDYGWNLMKQVGKRPANEAFPALLKFKRLFSRPCKVRFLGIFDTVKSVGWIYSPFSFPYTASNNIVKTVRHAVALDERRCFFRQNLWYPTPGQDSKEVWFAGVHADIGGGYPEAESALAKIPLAWICTAAQACGLLVDPAMYQRVVLGQGSLNRQPMAAPNPLAPQHESLRGPWKIVEWLPRRYKDSAQGFRTQWELPMFNAAARGRNRRIAASPIVVHPTVAQRVAGGAYTIPPVSGIGSTFSE